MRIICESDSHSIPSFIRSDGAQVDLLPEPACLRCSKPIKADFAPGLCYDCAGVKPTVDGVTLQRVLAATLYISGTGKKPSVCDEIWELKERLPGKAALLAEILVAAVNRHPDILEGVTLITSAPRGSTDKTWDQAKLLAEEVSRDVSLPYSPLLQRVEATVPRHEMSSEDKSQQELVPMFVQRRLQNDVVLVVDDTFVRGGTMAGAAAALKEAGARSVRGLVLGRSVDRGALDYLGLKLVA